MKQLWKNGSYVWYTGLDHSELEQGWYYSDEVQYPCGPFDTEEQATIEAVRYAKAFMERENVQDN